jgi:HlyD family secretion protein
MIATIFEHFSRKLLNKRFIFIALGAIVILLLGLRYWQAQGRNTRAFRTVPVSKGDLRATISATGTVEPEEVVDIGAQVAGRIVAFGKDKDGKSVDYGSVIEAGTMLAQIDAALYAADVALYKAQVQQNQAALKRAEADLGQYKAKLFQAERDWARARKLGPSEALSQADFDAARSAYETAKANLAVGKAAIIQAQKTILQSAAALQKAEQNLSYCTIRSPVKGVIVDRRVNIGQTVVASLSAPSLFLIAKDLKRMQLWVAVNEADIGNIRPGQPVTYTVDAYPGAVFKGEVGKVRLNAAMTQNVVTYTVEVITDNSSGKLLPYLTANAKFLVSEHQQALLAPNAALRWNPQPEQIVPGSHKGTKHQGASSKEKHTESGEAQTQGVLWIPQDSQVRPIPVRLGATDGSMTVVESDDIKEKTRVVIGERTQEAANAPDDSGGSPFAPKIFKPGSRH